MILLTSYGKHGATIYTDARQLSDPRDALSLLNFDLTMKAMKSGSSLSIKEQKVHDTKTDDY